MQSDVKIMIFYPISQIAESSTNFWTFSLNISERSQKQVAEKNSYYLAVKIVS